MASGPITSWQIDGETVETVTDFILWGSKITADGDCSYEIKICLFLERKVMTNLDSILKIGDITFLTKILLTKYSQNYGFSSSHIWCESWSIKKADCRWINAFKLWCWRRLLRVPWTVRRSNQSILQEINPEYSFERLMLKLQYSGHLMWRADSLEKPDAGKDWGQEEKGPTDDEMVGWHHWLNGHEFEYTPGVGDGQGGLAYCSPWVSKSQTWLSDWTELNCFNDCLLFLCVYCDFFTNIVVSHFSVF